MARAGSVLTLAVLTFWRELNYHKEQPVQPQHRT